MFHPKRSKLISIIAALVLSLGLVSLAMAQVTPSVTVNDQALADGQVTVAAVVSDGPGWIVIHAQADGAPGPVLGYSPVADGENSDVAVAIDEAGATEVLYAMLHIDAGAAGTYEFPGDDAPAKVDDQPVVAAFNLAIPELIASNEVVPSVTAGDQAITDGQVTVASVVSNGSGWIVIHAQADGAPGPVLGYSPVADGENNDVAVTIDEAGVTEVLYAMLHIDAGTVGTYEFPGDDAPATADDQPVVLSFNVTASDTAPETTTETAPAPTTLPVSGGVWSNWVILALLGLGGLLLLGGLALQQAKRA